MIDADQLIDCIRKSTYAVVISHEQEATKRLFAAVKYYIDNLEIKPAISIDSKREMKFPKRGSSYFIGTAGQVAFGRGDTVDRAHLSEAAFYFDLEKILTGISEAAEYGQIDIETTPNGREKFYDMWQKAKTGRSPYTNIFIPWYIDTEYSVDSMTDKEINGLSVSVKQMFAIPDAEFLSQLTIEEKRLVARVAEEYKFVLTAGQLKWRRYKIWDKGDLFWQEYPEDDVSCFLQSGRTVFSHITTDITKRIPLDDFENWATANPVEAKALSTRTLYGGVDGAEGVVNGDNHVFAVLDAPVNGKAVVVFEYVSTEPIDIFWQKIKGFIIDKETGQPKFRLSLAIEKNGVGVAHVNKAKDLGIIHTEFITGPINRPIMITDLEEAYRKGNLIETYPEAEDEARNMIYTKSNRPEHQGGKHDDRIFSRAIALQQTLQPVPRMTW